jgi:RNA polymerase sigma-54 factor
MRDVPHLARALGSTPAQVEAVCERIRHLDPRPGGGGGGRPPPATPTMAARDAEGESRAVGVPEGR